MAENQPVDDADWVRIGDTASQYDYVTANVLALPDFLYRMGREAQQGAVGIHIMRRYMEIPGNRYEQE